MSSRIYPVPALGTTVRNKETERSLTKADQPLDGIIYPCLSVYGADFPAGTELEVMKIIPFPKSSWKVLVKHKDGRMVYLADWQLIWPEEK